MSLIAAVCDDRVTPGQFKEIQSLVCTDREVRRLYVQMMHLHAGLYYFASALPDMMDPAHMAANMPTNIMDAPIRLDEAAAAQSQQLGMNETMVLPALTEKETDPGDLETGQGLVFPGTGFDLTPPKQPKVSPLVIKGGIAAGVLLALGLVLQTLPSKQPPAGAMRAVNPEVEQPVAPSVSPLVSPVVPPTLPPVHYPVHPVHYVAALDLISKPVWESALSHPDGVVAGDRLAIKSGVVQLRLFPAGRLVVEGPADVLFLSETEIRVRQGKIVANYPGGGLIVQCPTGSIKDLGTEFGISVNPTDGNAEVEVFQGQVAANLSSANLSSANLSSANLSSANLSSANLSSAALSSKATTQPVEPMVLKVGQAAVLTQSALTQTPQGAIKQRFICNLSNQQVTGLDVTDLICGGDGTTHRRGIAVDAVDGSIGKLEPVGLRTGDGNYHPSHGIPVVDGAFVPDGTHGAMKVDSAGHQFAFPPTTNSAMNRIWTGGPIPWADELGISTVIGNVDYSTNGHGIICTHCDNAITLDLDAVRRIYPDRTLTGFHCQMGNSYVNGVKGAAKMNPVTSAYVLIDGSSRFEKVKFTNQGTPFSIDVPLTRTDRFLTLAALDDGNDIDRDWILWTDPKLTLSPN